MYKWVIGKTKFSKPCRVFNGVKFTRLNNGYYISTTGRRLLSHEVWNAHYPNDIVLGGEIIRHFNYVRDDDRIENYRKILRGEHISNHQSGNGNSMYGKVGRFRQSNCDWDNCALPHRKGGFCEKHYALIRYWLKKGYLLNEIKDVVYLPFAKYRERDFAGKFV